MIVSEILFGSAGLGIGSGLTISGLAPIGIVCAVYHFYLVYEL